MPQPSRPEPPRSDKTPTGIKIPARKRSAVLRDFEKASGPLRGQNRDRKPKA
jgi:hypothetical protein